MQKKNSNGSKTETLKIIFIGKNLCWDNLKSFFYNNNREGSFYLPSKQGLIYSLRPG